MPKVMRSQHKGASIYYQICSKKIICHTSITLFPTQKALDEIYDLFLFKQNYFKTKTIDIVSFKNSQCLEIVIDFKH